VVFAIDFATMPSMWCIGDAFAWREETRSIIRDHDLHVDAQYAQHFGEPGQYFVINHKNGQWYSKYGIVNSLMALPPMWLDYVIHGHVPKVGESPDLLIYNAYNILLSLLVCALLYAITGWYTKRTWIRVIYVLTVCYSTYYWFYQRAQDSKVYEVLFYTGAFYFLMTYLRGLENADDQSNQKREWTLMAMWACVGLLLLTRVLYGLLVPTIWILIIHARGRSQPDHKTRLSRSDFTMLIVPPFIAVALLAWTNTVKFGAPWLTGYDQWRVSSHWPMGRWQDGIWGILFDPQASMLLHFPIFLFGLFALPEFYRRYKLDAIVIFALPLALFLYLTKTVGWRGEWAYGPRYMLFMLPVLALPFVTYLDYLAQASNRLVNFAWAGVTVIALTYSTYLQFQANRLNFWAMYYITYGVDDMWNREMARYFLDHQMGVFNANLIRHKDDLDNLPFVAELEKRGLSGQQLQEYKDRLRKFATEENFYWKREPATSTGQSP